MKAERRDVPWLDPNHRTNRARVPPEELARYAGQYVAWSWDGTRIVGSDSDEETLVKRLDASGIDTERLVFGYVDAPGVDNDS